MRFVIFAITTMLLASSAMADEWRPMSEAPRDGATIEIQNSYGVQPWYDIYRLGGKMQRYFCMGGGVEQKCEFRDEDAGSYWVSQSRPGHILDPKDERYMKWRPYGSHPQYVDPTGGAQFTVDYWRR